MKGQAYLSTVLGPLPCKRCHVEVTWQRACYRKLWISPLMVLRDAAGVHRCEEAA